MSLAAVGGLVVRGVEGAEPEGEIRPLQKSVVIVEDDPAVRKAFTSLLENEGYTVWQCSDAPSFLERFQQLDGMCCCVVDLLLQGSSGWELVNVLSQSRLGIGFIVVSGHLDVRSAVRAMRAGAVAVLEKPTCDVDFLEAVRVACETTRRRRGQSLESEAAARKLDSLTPREREILRLVTEGQASKAIAHALGLSRRTVETFRSRILAKTGAQSTAELTRLVLLAQRRPGSDRIR